ncbi:hypothetical protein CHUAL_008134 [Chamberlinius hualienensis]
MPPVIETSHSVCALVNSSWEPQPTSCAEKLSKGPRSLKNETESLMTMFASGSKTSNYPNSSSCVGTSHVGGGNNPWGPIFKSRENFNEMHFC